MLEKWNNGLKTDNLCILIECFGVDFHHFPMTVIISSMFLVPIIPGCEGLLQQFIRKINGRTNILLINAGIVPIRLLSGFSLR